MTRAVLDRVGRDAPSDAAHKLAVLRLLLAVVAGAEMVLVTERFARIGHPRAILFGAAAVVVAAAAALARSPRFVRPAHGLLLGVMLVVYGNAFPNTANHQILFLLAAAALALVDPRDPRQSNLPLQALRWATVIFFFYTGLQKLWYGCYDHGEFFAYSIATGDKFGDLFRHLLPAAEIERLARLGPPVPGAGPYRLESAVGLALARGTIAAEMLIPFGLLLPRLRFAATLAALGVMAGIQLGAREFVFGAFFLTLIGSFWSARAYRRTVIPIACGMLLLIALRLVAPDWNFA